MHEAECIFMNVIIPNTYDVVDIRPIVIIVLVLNVIIHYKTKFC